MWKFCAANYTDTGNIRSCGRIIMNFLRVGCLSTKKIFNFGADQINIRIQDLKGLLLLRNKGNWKNVASSSKDNDYNA